MSQQTKIPAFTLGSYESDDYKEPCSYEKAENFVGASKQRLAYIFSQLLKIKPTEKNIDDMAYMLGQSEILEPDAKKRGTAQGRNILKTK